jgi:hypothetical protein
MSAIDHPTVDPSVLENDRRVRDELTTLRDRDGDDKLRDITYALENNASLDLIALLVVGYFHYEGDYADRAEFYAHLVIDKRGEDFARALIELLCTTEREYQEDFYHRRAFWADPVAQDLFRGDDAGRMSMKLARLDPSDFISKYRDTLVAWFERVGITDGLEILVQATAAQSLTYVYDEPCLKAAMSLNRDALLRLAARGEPNAWHLVLMGYAMAKCSMLQRTEIYRIWSKIREQLARYPHQAPLIWRWVAQGYYLFAEEECAELGWSHDRSDVLANWRRHFFNRSNPIHDWLTEAGWFTATVNRTTASSSTTPPAAASGWSTTRRTAPSRSRPETWCSGRSS